MVVVYHVLRRFFVMLGVAYARVVFLFQNGTLKKDLFLTHLQNEARMRQFFIFSTLTAFFIFLFLPPILVIAETAQKNPTASRLLFTQEIDRALAVLADGLENEIALCLLGEIMGDTAIVSSFFMPPILRSEPNRVTARSERCPLNTIAWWHNHPLGSCALFPKDVENARKRPFPFAVVHTRRDLWCWWSRKQIIELSDLMLKKDPKKIVTLYPPDGQYVFGHKKYPHRFWLTE